jgi:hypothetical protein
VLLRPSLAEILIFSLTVSQAHILFCPKCSSSDGHKAPLLYNIILFITFVSNKIFDSKNCSRYTAQQLCNSIFLSAIKGYEDWEGIQNHDTNNMVCV